MKNYLLIALSILLTTCTRQMEQQADPRPNIVLILVDDLGKEWISAYGAEEIETPNIDALAKNGLRFDNVYSMPQCTPTRLTLLTGQYPFRHGWVNHWDVPRWGGGAHFDESYYPSLGSAMKAAGYKTAIAGKWQIDDFRVEPDALTRNGFDDFCMWTGYESENPPSAERYHDPYLFTKSGSTTYTGQFGPDIFRDFLINFIDQYKEQPFFIYYPMVLTHPPLVNTPDEEADDLIGKHKAMVRYTDKITGQLVEALRNRGVLENTLIIWTTDNGTSRGLDGQYQGRLVKGAKGSTVEAGINAPFIACWPKRIKKGEVSKALVDFTDLFPTLLDVAGVPPMKKWRVGEQQFPLDGYSFKGVLTGDTIDSPRQWILGMGGGNNARLTNQGVENQYVFRDRVLRDKRYKLYINSERIPERFIDLQKDPAEQVNLIDSLDTPDRQQHFDQLVKVIPSFPERDADPQYTPNPAQDWDVEITAKSEVWKKGAQ